MGRTSRRLHRRLASQADSLPTVAPNRRPGEPLPGNVKDVEMLIEGGLDPVHAVYSYLQQITSVFAEGMSQFPELRKYVQIVGRAEDEYMPSGPPISPLTVSYFTCWAFFDVQVGDDTLASCMIDANDVIGLNPDQLDGLKKMSASRMGIYEHCGVSGPHVRLRELLTNEEFICHCASGYRGRKGELLYVRLLPPLLPELANYHVAFTTPYMLIDATKEDWAQFLRRAMLNFKDADDRTALHRLLKHGPDPNYWNEFVFKAYHHHQPEVIFLTGVPDLKSTLPHA